MRHKETMEKNIKDIQSEKQRDELDKIAKLLVRRDFELSEIREKREKEFEELKGKTKDLEDSRRALMNILNDIEEEKNKAEEEKNKTLAIITNFSDGLLVFDAENKVSLINPPAEVFFQIKAAQIVGKSILELAEIPSFKSLIILLGGALDKIFRKEFVFKNDLILELSTIPIMRDQIKKGTMLILHDVSREKAVEKLKTEFVSLSAHQLRTPLSAIKWTLRMLLDGDLGDITQEQREFLEKTYKSNERMINLINDLLNVARIEEGKYIFKPALTDIELVVESVVNSYQEEVKKRKINLEYKKPERKLPKVTLDVEKMRLAIQNLMDNAVKYTPQGGKVSISLMVKKKEIEFKIKDTGIGISEEQRKRLFTKFFRGVNAVKMETEGSGLGLFIAKNIIEAHKGNLWVESTEGKGSTFYFTLPADVVEKEVE